MKNNNQNNLVQNADTHGCPAITIKPHSLSDKIPFVQQEAKNPNMFLVLAFHYEFLFNDYLDTLLSGVVF